MPPLAKQQELLLRRGAASRLVAILLRFSDHEALEAICLQALCNLSGMGLAEGAGMVWEKGASVKPGESVFHGVSPYTCGFGSSVTMVHVSQWAPGQYSVSIEVFQRCSSSFWNHHGSRRTVHWFPFSSFGGCSDLYKVIKYSARIKSLRTRVFHTFLWQLTDSKQGDQPGLQTGEFWRITPPSLYEFGPSSICIKHQRKLSMKVLSHEFHEQKYLHSLHHWTFLFSLLWKFSFCYRLLSSQQRKQRKGFLKQLDYQRWPLDGMQFLCTVSSLCNRKEMENQFVALYMCLYTHRWNDLIMPDYTSHW